MFQETTGITKPKGRQLWIPILAIIAIVLAAGMGGVATSQSIGDGWYTTLRKSELNPPNAVFGPAWTFLYTLMGMAFVICWNKAPIHANSYKMAFGVQIGLNLLWSIIFFGMKSPLMGLIVIGMLIAARSAAIDTCRLRETRSGM